jgi:hypothetical protein
MSEAKSGHQFAPTLPDVAALIRATLASPSPGRAWKGRVGTAGQKEKPVERVE